MARPFIPVEKVCKFELRYTTFGQKIENVIYVKAGVDWTEGEALDLCDALAAWFIGEASGALSVQTSLNSIRVTNMASAEGFAFDYTESMPLTGVVSGTVMPLNVTASIKLGTAKRGRSYTGRNYWPAMVISYTNGNQLSNSGLAAIKTVWEALKTAISEVTSSPQLVVVSFVHNKQYRTAGVATPVTSISVDGNLDSQRRRLTTRGQ